MSLALFIDQIIQLDETVKLCDGEVRGYINPKNLKYSLAKRKNLIWYIHKNLKQ